MGALKSIIGETFGKFLKAFWAKFCAYLTQAYPSPCQKQSYQRDVHDMFTPNGFVLEQVCSML